MLPSKINAGVLLTDRITQPFAVSVIVAAADPRAGFRKPPGTHRVFQSTTLTINRPHSMVENGETTEATTATAASVRQTRAARRAPVEHLHFEIMSVPVVCRHTNCYSTFDAVDLLALLLPRHGRLARFSVSQPRFRLDLDSAPVQLAVVQKAKRDGHVGDFCHFHKPESAAEPGNPISDRQGA